MPTVCISKIKLYSAPNYLKRFLLVLVVIALGFFCLASGVASADTSLMMTSEAEDYIGQGLFYYYSSSDGDFSAQRNYQNGVSLAFLIPDYSHFWYLDFTAPNNAPLAVGTYLGATRFPFQDADKPGLSVYGDGRGCNTLTGSFEVKEVTYGPNDEVLSFWASFVQHCEGEAPELRGEIRYNADSPNSVTGIKTTSSPSVAGQSITFTANVAGAGGVPTGTVFFKDGQNTLGSVLLSGNPASAAFTTSALSIGTHSIIAVFIGNSSNFEASSSAVLNQVVEMKGATILMMTELFGQGQTWDYSLKDGTFFAWRNYDNGVSLSFHTPDYSHWWYLDFAAPNNNPLAVGTYLGATDFPFHDSDEPGLGVLGDWWVCNTLIGSFKVKEVTYGSNDEILSFWATFEQYCEGFPDALRGEIRFHAHVPDTITFISSSQNPSLFGQSVAFTATVTSPVPGIPTGTVTFMDESKVLGTAVLSGSPATATLTTAALPAGKHKINAVYSGDSNFLSSTSSALRQIVRRLYLPLRLH